ncbi:MAG: isocitrate lyase/phosphoenolpyruvate mutase family protein [Deltaproteobacteria bacterium]
MSTVHNLPKGSLKSVSAPRSLQIRNDLESEYSDIYTPQVLDALKALSVFNKDQKMLMEKRYARRAQRFRNKERIRFLNPEDFIPRTNIKVQDARDGKFVGSDISHDLERQWIQGTGPAAKPNTSIEKSIRNVAYALLSGADGWMFDGEDALGQINTMSLDNQRNLKLAINKDPVFMDTAERISRDMNEWAQGFFGRDIITDWRKQLDFTTKIFRARGLHLDDRHIRDENGIALSASIVDVVLYIVNNYRELQSAGSSIVLYLPKIQTAEEAAFWNELLTALEDHLDIPVGSIKVYVLIEQLEATFQLMEIRAALGRHFVGFNTGRWDYINSVSDAMAWDATFINPNIESITMTYGYMRNYEDRVRKAVNTPGINNNYALWQGGMEPNIPVGTKKGVEEGMKKAVAGAVREQKEGASGKWVAHWKMVHIVRPVWEKVGEANQMGRKFLPLTYTDEDADGLTLLEPAPRTVRGARNLLSVGLQYGNAFGQGFQAAALKPADFFGNDDILYLMEDAATGEIRLSILWEWIHKEAILNENDKETGVKAGDIFTVDLFEKLLAEEYDKLLKAKDKDVHDDSKPTTLPIAREIVETYVLDDAKTPWYIDLLNINLNNHDLSTAKIRIRQYMDAFKKDGTRITENLDFLPDARLDNFLEDELVSFEREVQETKDWFATSRFKGIRRLYSARQVVQQRGTLETDYTVARRYSEEFYNRLRELYSRGEQITSFGPYSPGQVVAMKRIGIEGIYLGGWATSAKGSTDEDPGSDLASYPLSQVPDEAAVLVRALLTADKNQKFFRSRMSDKERKATPRVDYRPFIIADADTGHGGDAHVRNLIRRFVEAGVTGYHIEDQKPGTKKCGHQGGKVLVPVDEQVKRLNAARFQLDIMKVAGIIVARTDAEAATLLDGRGDERDHPFILGATNTDVPGYKNCYLAILKRFFDKGITDVNGFMLYQISNEEYEEAYEWFDKVGLTSIIDKSIQALKEGKERSITKPLDNAATKFVETWEVESGLMTYAQAVADEMEFQIEEGRSLDMTIEKWFNFAKRSSFHHAREKARSMGIEAEWDCELSRTPEGYYQVKGGIEYAIAKSLAVAPYADLIWMETKTADYEEAKEFAEAIHAVYPDKMLAYNLSPSFNWDTTGMSEEEMREFPKEIGKLGFVFNFITYGGHQIDGLAAEEFATALRQDGMLALARLQRKFRLLDSPYRTPQSLVGGPRLDGALSASSGRTATTKAMGKGSTQVQHLVETEVPPRLLENWLELWSEHYGIPGHFSVKLKPHTSGSELLELMVIDDLDNKVADVIFSTIHDRWGSNFISVRDQNTYDLKLRQKRLMALIHLFLIHRYKAVSVHYVSPTEDNQKQAEGMKSLGIYDEVNTEIGHIIVARINMERVKELLSSDLVELKKFIAKKSKGKASRKKTK